ncbi:MAG: SDR family oxidoreductase [Acidobacteriota bacterium]
MNTSLHGRRALVCGGTRGIGRATAEALARLNAQVTVVARDRGKLDETLAALTAASPGPHGAIAADAAQPEVMAQRVAENLATHGPIHVLVNNTGGPPGGPITAATSEAFLAAFTAHLLTAQAVTRLLLPGMQAAHYGRVINIISTSVKSPLKGLGVSNTVRAAVASWAKTLAGEVGAMGITVNNVLPGMTRTDRLAAIIATRAEKEQRDVAAIEREMIGEIPAGRFGEAQDVAAAVAFLASPAAAYVNGINLPVDGGRTGCL